MGQGATSGRRALIEKVKDCLKQTNAMTGLATDLREKHDTLVKQHTVFNGRLDVYKAWIERVESTATREAHRLTSARIECGRVGTQVVNFIEHMTFGQRLRWLLTGRTPVLTTEPQAVEQADKADKPELAKAYTDFAQQPHGQASAGMAPRPLP